MTRPELDQKWAEFRAGAGQDLKVGASTSRVVEKEEEGYWEVRLGCFKTQSEADDARSRFGQALAEKFGDAVEFEFMEWQYLDL